MARKRKRRPRRPPPKPPAEPPAAPARAKETTGAPPPPWGSFPLSEIVVVIAIVLLVGGFFVGPPRGAVMIGAGLVLGSLAGLELAVREHFAGYRSHTSLLAGAVGVAVLASTLTLTKLDAAICVGGAVVAFGGCAWLFANAFRRRSGGALFRFGAGR